MKLLKYLNNVINETEKNIIRTGKIQLVEQPDVNNLLPSLKEKKLIKKIDRLLSEANRKLKRDVPYGRHKFAFVLEEENGIDKIKTDEDTKDKIKKRWLVLNSELAKIQMDWEEKN